MADLKRIRQKIKNIKRKLDDLDGRGVDNANFFHVNDIASISDDQLSIIE